MTSQYIKKKLLKLSHCMLISIASVFTTALFFSRVCLTWRGSCYKKKQNRTAKYYDEPICKNSSAADGIPIRSAHTSSSTLFLSSGTWSTLCINTKNNVVKELWDDH